MPADMAVSSIATFAKLVTKPVSCRTLDDSGYVNVVGVVNPVFTLRCRSLPSGQLLQCRNESQRIAPNVLWHVQELSNAHIDRRR